jgi:proteasome lid subunit RPN8/RPN11
VTQPIDPALTLNKELADRLIGVCVEALPGKAYGLVGGKDAYRPENLYPCSTNLRNTPEWKSLFEAFGDFYRDPDRGFVISPEEQGQIMSQIEARGESFIGVFHSHRFTSPDPTELDMAFHFGPHMFCYIVSVVKPDHPELKIYRLEDSAFQDIPFRIV